MNESSKYRYFLEYSLQVYFLSETNGKIIECNKRACEVFGYTELEITKLTRTDLLLQNDHFKKYILECSEKGEAQLVLTGIRKNGEQFPFRVSSKLFIEPETQKQLSIILGEDISAEDKLEKDLESALRFLKQTNQQVRIGGWEYDFENQKLSWSDITAELHEVEPGFVPDFNTAINFYKEGESRAKITEAFSELINSEKPYLLELQIVTAKGRTIWVRTSGSGEFAGGKCIKVYGTFQDIQQQKEEEEARLFQEQQYRSLFYQNPNPVFSLDNEGCFLSWNEQTLKFTEWFDSEKQFASMMFPELIEVNDQGLVKQMIKQVISGNPVTYEATFVTLKQNIRHGIVSHMPIYNQGKVIGIFGIIQDITNSRQAEELLRSSEYKLSAYFNSTTDSVCVLNQKMDIISFNKIFQEAIEKIWGKTPAIGENILLYAAPGTIDIFEKNFNLAMTGEPVQTEREINYGNTKTWWANRYSPVYDNRKQLIGVAFTSTNIDKRKRAEIALKEKQQELEQIYDTINDIIFKIEVEDIGKYKFVTVNQAFCNSTGFTLEQVINHYTFDIIPEESLPMVHSKYEEAIRLKKTISWEETTPFRNELKTGIVTISPLFDEYGKPTFLIGNIHDISELKKSQRKIEESLRQLNHQRFALDQHSIVSVTDARGIITYVNDKFCEVSKYAHEELIGQDYQILNSGIHPNHFFTELSETISSGKVWHGALCNRSKDGKLFWLQTTIVPFSDTENGPPVRYITIHTDITQERENMEALKSNKEYLRTIFDYSLTAIIVADDNGNYIDVNDHACKMFGYKREEFIQMNVRDLNVKSMKSTGEMYSEYLAKGIDKGEFNFYRKDGTLVNSIYQAIHIRENFNVSILIDISDRVKMEQERYTTQKLLEEIFNTVHDVLFVLEVEPDNRFRYITINEAFSEFTGIPLTERINKYLHEVVPKEVAEKEIAHYNHAIEAKKTVTFQIEVPYLTGVHTAIISASPLFNTEGKPIRLICSARDITDIIDSQNEIKKLSLIARQTINVAIITDPKGHITWVNKAFEQISGFTLNEVLGKKPGSILQGPDSDPEVIAHMHDKLEACEPFDVNIKNYRKDGTHYWIRIYCQPMLDNAGNLEGFFAIETDITSDKVYKEEKEQLIRELTESNYDLRQFSYITSHNLRAPLTNLVSIANILELPEEIDEETRQLIEGFKTSTYHLNETLNDLINILIIKESKNIETQKIQLVKVLQNIQALQNDLITRNKVDIQYDFSEAPLVYFSSAYLDSIFLNLISNAIKYRSEKRNLLIQIKSQKINNKIRLTFSDNGIGFNYERVRNRVFGLYQRFHTNIDGKGIGLYLIKSQLLALGGEISVYSEEDKGTTFTIDLPDHDNI